MRFIKLSLFCAISLCHVSLQGLAGTSSRSTYQHLTVKGFEAESGDQIPPDFREALRSHLLKHLRDTKRFQDITILDTGNAPPSNSDILLSGKIIKFDKGSRMERYMVPGLGSTSIRAEIEYTDPASGRSLLKTQVSGRVSFGLFGGDSKGATDGLAKGLAKATKKNLP
jgi:hypothetical protein